ncbi:tetratricopeptide repeat protein [Acidisphaera sp. S103]|uniref:tetratricopeptide repeat protein n=1 Tax=Acidisphaera sp. S103 TaxID=1747223 RepID=UPI00131E9C39|nr:tetratricopeptide repeat protein [Acidisphaera sp. S103]
MKKLVPFGVVLGVSLLALTSATWWSGWAGIWASPDQRGRRLFDRGRYADAAETFLDPMWIGAALMKAGNFKDAAGDFGGVDTAEAAYDQGNALVMLGRYDDAVGRYDRALALRAGWSDAAANREIARLRADRVRAKGADPNGMHQKPDSVVYDKTKKDQRPPDTADATVPMSDQEIRMLWLKRVQTRPADFLRARFVFQLQAQKR